MAEDVRKLVLCHGDKRNGPPAPCQVAGCDGTGDWFAFLLESRAQWWLCERHASPATVRKLLETASDLDS